MNNIKINEQIIDEIRKQCGSDQIIEEFLTELIYQEAEHPGQWHWKESYNDNIDKYLRIMEGEK